MASVNIDGTMKNKTAALNSTYRDSDVDLSVEKADIDETVLLRPRWCSIENHARHSNLHGKLCWDENELSLRLRLAKYE